MAEIIRMCDISFDKELFENFSTGTVLDRLLCSYDGLPKGVNYMIIGDPGTGKTTIILDMLANIMANHPMAEVLFVSAEMNEIDLSVYVQRFPKFRYINILFVESDISENGCTHHWSAFLTIQQVTKTGNFIGSNRLKHSITAMMELRLDNPKNIYSDRYVVFSKHRRGDVGVRLYYNLSTRDNVEYDEERFEKDVRIRKMQSDVSSQIRDYADRFDELFTV